MADGNTVCSPTVYTEEVNMKEMKVKLRVDGILPRMFGDKQKPKNGTVDVKFSNFGFEMTATVSNSKGMDRLWALTVKKLPSEIEVNQSTWKVEKGMIVLSLHKKEEVSWAAKLGSGLEQATSSDNEDEGEGKKVE